jgi:peptidoglycan/xylan/chitin deacetylase (PgdA/CDA1 family)
VGNRLNGLMIRSPLIESKSKAFWLVIVALGVVIVATSFAAYRSRPSESPRRAHVVVMELQTSRRAVALSFDMGADVGYTAAILNTLQQSEIKASFGVTGEWAKNNPHLVERIAKDGHTLINHSYSHRSFTGVSTSAGGLDSSRIATEILRTESIIRRITGRTTKPYFRPPYGDLDHFVIRHVHSLGFSCSVMWDVDSLGWRGLTKDEIVHQILRNVRPGSILLFHVGAGAQDGPALPSIIAALRDQGYEFWTIDDACRD